MYLFKKIIARLFFPVPLSLGLIWAGLALMWIRPHRQIGKWLLSGGAIVLTLLSFHPFSYFLLEPLESQYPPFNIPSPKAGKVFVETQHVKWVVVLSRRAGIQPNFPLVSQLSRSSVVRLIEGISLYRHLPGVKLLVSGSEDESRLMYQFALRFGVPEESLTRESQSRDTKDQAKYIAAMVKQDGLVLVTEASHMPRSIALFRKQGLSPIAAPVGHLVRPNRPYKWWSLFPNAGSLKMAERAVYEYLGMAWAMIRDQI